MVASNEMLQYVHQIPTWSKGHATVWKHHFPVARRLFWPAVKHQLDQQEVYEHEYIDGIRSLRHARCSLLIQGPLGISKADYRRGKWLYIEYIRLNLWTEVVMHFSQPVPPPPPNLPPPSTHLESDNCNRKQVHGSTTLVRFYPIKSTLGFNTKLKSSIESKWSKSLSNVLLLGYKR